MPQTIAEAGRSYLHRALQRIRLVLQIPSASLGMTKGRFALPFGLDGATYRQVEEVVISTITPNGSSALPFVIPSVPGFPVRGAEKAACAVFCKENRMVFAMSPSLTGIRGSRGICSFLSWKRYIAKRWT